VVTARDAHALFAGKPDGSVLAVLDIEPLKSWATDVDALLKEPDLFLLGVAHRACVPSARARLESQEVELPDDLPPVITDEEVGELPPLHQPPGGRLCPFCGAADIGEEHVWPRWVSRELVAIGGGFEVTTTHGRERRRSLELTVPVCETCNTRWLSTLENDTRPVLAPMIRGESRMLEPDEQHLLATWAVKMAFMLDLAAEAPFIPLGFYYEFRQQRAPLASMAVWLGAYAGSRRAVFAHHKQLDFNGSRDRGEPPNGFVTTFSGYRVVFQVLGHFHAGGATFLDRREHFAPAIHAIWPRRQRQIEWPRQLVAPGSQPSNLGLNDDSLREFATSIRG